MQLKCSADNYTYESLQWYRLDPRALQDEAGKSLFLDCRSLHLYATRLDGQLAFDGTTNSWVLELSIPNIQLHHEGNYVCEVQNRRSGEKHCHRKYIPVRGEDSRQTSTPTNQSTVSHTPLTTVNHISLPIRELQVTRPCQSQTSVSCTCMSARPLSITHTCKPQRFVNQLHMPVNQRTVDHMSNMCLSITPITITETCQSFKSATQTLNHKYKMRAPIHRRDRVHTTPRPSRKRGCDLNADMWHVLFL